ncbi:MAG: hypothetical protein KDB03_28600 [Planctomycetales bacterium]|nr:hypothetical protein [Planctomycetales bacterium]
MIRQRHLLRLFAVTGFTSCAALNYGSAAFAETIRVDRLDRETEVFIQRGWSWGPSDCFTTILGGIVDAKEGHQWLLTFNEDDGSLRFAHETGLHLVICGESGRRVIKLNSLGDVISDRLKRYD